MFPDVIDVSGCCRLSVELKCSTFCEQLWLVACVRWTDCDLYHCFVFFVKYLIYLTINNYVQSKFYTPYYQSKFAITRRSSQQLPMQSVPIATEVVSSNLVHCEVYSIQHYVIKFVSDLRHFSGFLWVLRFPPPITLTATI